MPYTITIIACCLLYTSIVGAATEPCTFLIDYILFFSSTEAAAAFKHEDLETMLANQPTPEPCLLYTSGLYYSRDPYDLERFRRIRESSAEIVSRQAQIPKEQVIDLFCGETGYQTPKLDSRAAVFRDGKILLVQAVYKRQALNLRILLCRTIQRT